MLVQALNYGSPDWKVLRLESPALGDGGVHNRGPR
jgi:hypothetical protein